jgi:predicted ArsR family transcriptional regulator
MTTPSPIRRPGGRRAEILRALRDAGEPLGIAEIAARVGVHLNTVRFHLDALVAAGTVERTRAELGTPGRPPQLYRAAQGMDPAGPRHYRVLAEVLVAALADDPDPVGRATEAGRVWGEREASGLAAGDAADESARADASTDLLIGMLDDLGFAPERDEAEAPSRIGLRSCPFLELAVDHADVVCPVHLGLMQGAMSAWRSPVSVDGLDRFVEPDLCVVHLGVAGVGSTGTP